MTHSMPPTLAKCTRSMDTSVDLAERDPKAMLPPIKESYQTQFQRCKEQLKAKSSDLERYVYLSQLRQFSPDLFYRLLLADLSYFTPLVYTPTVGLACQRWSHIFINPEGLYLPVTFKGKLSYLIDQWPNKPEICVVTDGSRILGLGDLGVGGLGISVGKLALYTTCAGIHPNSTLPIVFDFGTNNESLLEDPLYLGIRQRRVSKEVEKDFIEEFMATITEKFPDIIIQFEDFTSTDAFRWLDLFRDRYACFNDDIQGTGAVILSGFQKAVELSGIPPDDQRIVFYGAGSAAVGVAKMLSHWIQTAGNLSEEEAKSRVYLVDTKGLVCDSRGDKLPDHKVYFSRNDVRDTDLTRVKSLPDILRYAQPTALIGLCTVGGVFNSSILQYMAKINDKPIIMPLSNPSSNSECSFEEAMHHTNGKVIFASGSPFPALNFNGRNYVPGQGNNMYIFPGLGMGCILSKTKQVTEEMIFAAATALSHAVLPSETAKGLIYPELSRIREVSLQVTKAVMLKAQEQGVGEIPKVQDLEGYISSRMYDPFYGQFIPHF